LLRKFHRRTNPMKFLVTILGSKNQKKYSDFWNLTSLGYLPYKYRLRRLNLSFVSEISRWDESDGTWVTILGSRNKNKHSRFWYLTSQRYFLYKFRLKKDKPWVFLSKFRCRTILMHFSLLISGKFHTRPTSASNFLSLKSWWSLVIHKKSSKIKISDTKWGK
jgi:hypothetical protein